MAEVTIKSNEGQSLNLSNEEAALLDEISIQVPDKTVPLRAKPAKPSVFTKKAPGNYMIAPEQQAIDGLDMFVNPGKRTAPPPPPVEEYDGGDEEEGEQYEQQEEGYAQPQVPSEGYKTIEDEKADLLNKIDRLKQKGFKTAARLNIYSDIDEIRTEYKRITYGIEVERSIKFQRRMLIACITGLEFLNEKFDPFDLELDGWSQNMMENVEDYDGVFEELYNKYKTKVNVAPEVKLVLMVGGSAMMFHLTKSMTKAFTPNIQNMMNAPQRPPQGGFGSPVETSGRRDMRGPGMDFGSLMSMMGPPPPMMTRPGNKGGDDESVSDIVSIDAGGDPETKEVSLDDSKRKRKSKKKEVTI